MRSLLAPGLAFVCLVTACTGHRGGGDDDDSTPPPPYAIRFLDILDPVEETPQVFRIEVTTTGGEPVAWSGTVALTSLAGPLSPSSLEVTDGAGQAGLVFELAGFGGVALSHADLRTEVLTAGIRPRLPVKIAGAAEFGSVLSGGSGWDSDGAWAPSAILDGPGVRLYYASSTTGGAANIGTAYAADGVAFTPAPGPVIGPAVSGDACHADGADHPAAIRRGDGTVVLLYEGRSGAVRQLCLATSTDGLAFTVQGVAIAPSPDAGTFDHDAVRGGSLVEREDGSLLAYYGGESVLEVDGTNPGPETVSGIGTAVSTDGGLVWTRVPGVVHGAHVTSFLESTNISSWDGLAVYAPGAMRDGSVYRIWITGMSGAGARIGLYETENPFELLAHVDNLEQPLHEIVPAGDAGAFDDEATSFASVVEHGGVRRLYYTGVRAADGVARIGTATFP